MQLNLTSESFSQHSFSPSSSRVRECVGPLQGSTRTIASQFHLQSIRERRNRSQRNRRWKWVNVLPKILILTSRWSWHFVRGADYINVSICTLSRTRFCSTFESLRNEKGRVAQNWENPRVQGAMTRSRAHRHRESSFQPSASLGGEVGISLEGF